MRKKLLKITLILILILIILPVITLSILVHVKRDFVLQEVVLFLNEQTEGELSIQGLDYSALRGFPDLQVEVENLELKKDTVTLLEIGHLIVNVNTIKLLGGNVMIEELGIEDALLVSVVDSMGNKPKLFTSANKSKTGNTSSQLLQMDEIRIVKTRLVLGNDYKHNRKYIYINEGKFQLNSRDSLIIVEGSVDGRLDTLIANQNVLFRNQPVRAEHVVLEINRNTNELALTGCDLFTHDLKLKMGLHFTPFQDGQMTVFTIDGEQHFNSFLDVFEFNTDLDLEQVNPSARLVLSYKESGFVNPFERPYSDLRFMIQDAEFSGDDLPFPIRINLISGNYDNGEEHSPKTVELVIDTLDAEVNKSSIQARFKLTNLIDPIIDAHLVAKVELGHFIKQTSNFKLSGSIEADLRVDGKINEIRQMHLEGKQSAYGRIDVSNLLLSINDQAFTLEFNNGSTLLNNHILEVTTLVGAFNQSVFNFNGRFRNLDQYLTNRHDNLLGAFHLNFTELDLTAIDFKSFKQDDKAEAADFSFEDIALDFFLNGDRIITPFGHAENVKLNCRLDGRNLDIQKFNFKYQEGWIDAKGKMSFGQSGIQSIYASLIGDFDDLEIDFPDSNVKKGNSENPMAMLPQEISIDLDLDVKKGSVQEIGFENLKLRSSLVNENFFLEKFEADVFDGHASLNGKAHLKEMVLDELRLYGNLGFNHLDLTPLFRPNTEDTVSSLPILPEDLDVDIHLYSALTTYYDAEIKDLNVELKATNEQIKLEELYAILPFGQLNVELTVDQYSKEIPEYSGSLELNIDTLIVDDLLAMQAFNPGGKKEQESANQEKEFFLAEFPDLADLKIKTTATIITFEKAVFENLQLEGDIVNKGMELKKLKLNFAGGNIDIHGSLKEDKQGRFPGYLYSHGDQIDITQVFQSFDNFDQQIFTAENSSGMFSTTSHYYFQLDQDFEFQVDENLWLLNVFINHAEFDQVEPIEKTLFFVGHKSKDEMMVHQLNMNAYVIGNKIYFRDIYLNDNIADMGVFGEVDIEEMKMDLALEVSLTDLFFRTRKNRKTNTEQGLYSLDKDSKLFLQLEGPLDDHKMRKINKRKFNNYWDEMDALIKAATTEFRERKQKEQLSNSSDAF